MLTHDVGMHVLLIDLIILGQSCAQTGGIQNGTGTDDLLLGQTGALAEGVRQNINRVADNHVLGIGSVAGDLRDDALGDIHVDLGQIQTGLAGLACHTGGEDNDVGVYRVAVVACIDGAGSTEGNTLTDIQGLAQCFLRVQIDHNDLVGDAGYRQCVSDGRAYAAGSDDGNLAHWSAFP